MAITHIGYTGQRQSTVSEQYPLGNGYRGFNPVLKRFAGQDGMSPFGAGGEHGFSYCGGNPVNRTDPSGHLFGIPGLFIFLMLGGDAAVAEGVSDEVIAESVDLAIAGRKSGPLMTYGNKESPQKPIYSMAGVHRLEKQSDDYILMNMEDAARTETPDGDYLFTVRSNTFTSAREEWVFDPRKHRVSAEHLQDEENIMRVIRKPLDIPEHPGDGYGHTSMTRVQVTTRHPVVARVYYAGELTFSQGKLTSWTNKSGHYRPADAGKSLLPSAVTRLLPLALYTGV